MNSFLKPTNEMVQKETLKRVRLAPADWGGLCSLALTILMMLAATLYQVHDLAATDRVQQARFDAELGHLKAQVRQLQVDVRLALNTRRPS